MKTLTDKHPLGCSASLAAQNLCLPSSPLLSSSLLQCFPTRRATVYGVIRQPLSIGINGIPIFLSLKSTAADALRTARRHHLPFDVGAACGTSHFPHRAVRHLPPPLVRCDDDDDVGGGINIQQRVCGSLASPVKAVRPISLDASPYRSTSQSETRISQLKMSSHRYNYCKVHSYMSI